MPGKIKVLIVDDSKIYRNFLAKSIENEDDIEIIGSVFNGKKALEFISGNQRPDVVTLDLEMPEMDGIETLKEINKINKNNPDMPDIGVIMVSSHTKRGANITMQCLEEGAFDFITKPDNDNPDKNLTDLNKQLVSKFRVFFYRKDRQKLRELNQEKIKPETKVSSRIKQSIDHEIKAIVIGSSTGGPKALSTLLPALTRSTDLPIFIVQHMPPFYTASLASNLDQKCGLASVKEGTDGEIASFNTVYIAPGGKHMVVKKNTIGNIVVELNDSPPENNCKPSVDVLFRSAGLVYGGNILAIILTGMGNDGTKGLKPLKRKGGHVILQDEKTSVVWGMPGTAFEAGLGDEILPLDKIADAAVRKINRGKNG